jgi:hypothetical protein
LNTQKTKRSYHGEAIAAPIVEFVNNPEAPAANRKLVLELIAVGQTLLTSRDKGERNDAKQRFNNLVLNVPFNPQIWTVRRGVPVIRYEAQEYGSVASYVNLWFELAERKLTGQLKLCEYEGCRRLFWARFPHANFHSRECRDAAIKDDPKWREKRRAYEVDYYHRKRKLGRKRP